MPTPIGSGGIAEPGKTFAVAFWTSQLCDNSLAEFQSETDFSWGRFSFIIDNVDDDNTVDVKILDTNLNILKTFNFTTNGRKEIDLSQFSEISSTQDIKIRFELTALT